MRISPRAEWIVGHQVGLEFTDRCPHKLPMISRCIALLLSLALAGCCASGVGCGTASAPPGPVAWDGLGSVPPENSGDVDNGQIDRKKVRQTARANGRVQPGDRWEQEQASDQAADAKLTRQLKICSNC